MAPGRSKEEKLRLAAVVRYQLRRAGELFEAGHVEAAETTGSGALLLLRSDDARSSALSGHEKALLLLAHGAARRGDSGRARALYLLALEANPNSSSAPAIREHLRALDDFTGATLGDAAVIKTGEIAREKLAAACVDPSADVFRQAQAGVIDWMDAALTSQVNPEGPGSRTEREEALEAYRAVRSGAPTLVALALRQGDPLAAIRVIDEAELSRALAPALRLRLEEAGESGSPDAYLDLFRVFDGIRHEGDLETSLLPELANAATFWSAIQLYRSNPGSLEHAMPLSLLLLEFGMPEVSTAVLARNLSPTTSPEALGWSLALVLRGMMELSQTNQTEAARQSFVEATPLLDLAASPRYRGAVPEPARVQALLAALEIRVGNLDRALPLLETAVERAPSPETLLRLAAVQRQKGDSKNALSTATRAVTLAGRAGNLLLEAQAEELLFELERDAGQQVEAGATLGRALEKTLTARTTGLSTVSEAAIERHLARLLEHYGDVRGARRAFTRALAASRKSPIEIELTLTDMARSALTSGDVTLARLATQSTVEVGMLPEDSVYIALWQKLTEERTKTTPDGSANQVITSANKASGWIAVLKQFSLGQLDAKKLAAAARTPVERTEALFYEALATRDAAESKKALSEVATSPALDLVEVRMARDLSAPRARYPLPEGVALP